MRMTLSLRLLAAVAFAVAFAASFVTGVAAQGERSFCADCHFSASDPPARDHLDNWSISKHGRAGVGCEKCHGGNPATTDRFPAHQGVLRSSNPSSPVHYTNLPRTCGSCHTGPYTQFQQSKHFALLADGERRGPTCTTCHESVAAQLVSPRGLEQRCNQCHGPRGREPVEGRAAEARLMLEDITDLRASLAAAGRLIERVTDPARHAQLRNALAQAEIPLTQARDAGHRFVFDELRSRMATARDRAALLMQLIVNPGR